MSEFRIGLLTILILGLFPTFIWACSNEGSISLFHWTRCWCVPRLVIWLLVSVVLSLICHTWIFPALLEQSRPAPMWPQNAMGWTLAIAWFGVCFTFVVVFGWVSDELRLQLKNSSGLIPGMPALDTHLGWLGILLLGLVGGFILTRVFRSRRRL